MLPAIDLDHQTSFVTHKVNDERTYRALAAKGQLLETMGAQRRPQSALCMRHVPAQSLGMNALIIFDRTVRGNTPLPDRHSASKTRVNALMAIRPPPQGGR
jgi:hypothetical protein